MSISMPHSEDLPNNVSTIVPAELTFYGWLHRIGANGDFELRHEGNVTPFEIESPSLRDELASLTVESVIQVTATSSKKSPSVLWQANAIICLSRAEPLPFTPTQAENAPATLRSRYRYLAFRDGPARQNLLLRHRLMHYINLSLHEQGFISAETPILSTPSASGAHEFRVRSADGRLEYALPQSAQVYGQLLVAGGIERYFQWSRCFRDEDLRANRQLEFTQLHLESAFMSGEVLRRLFSKLLVEVCRNLEIPLMDDFQKLSYDEVVSRYGDDKPDLRWGLRIKILPFIFAETSSKSPDPNHQLVQLCWQFDDASSSTIAELLPGLCASLDVNLLGYVSEHTFTEHFRSLHLTKSDLHGLSSFSNQWYPGSFPLLIGDSAKHNALHLSVYRHLREGRHSPPSGICFAWIVDYPLFAVDESSPDRLTPVSSPFAAPTDAQAFAEARKHRDLLRLRSTAFDLVCNGEEVASGSEVINNTVTQRAVFEAMGLSRREIRNGYGSWFDALKFGVPPMCGIGLGVDRFIACLLGEQKIRSVIAFPKTKQGYCPVMNSMNDGNYL